jgi:phosphotransferase system enzyme I (PtsI)
MGSVKSDNLTCTGIGASPGIVIAQALLTDRRRLVVEEEVLPSEAVAIEVDRFSAALLSARDELAASREQISRAHGDEHLYIIDSHLMIFDDPMLTTETLALIRSERLNAEGALKRAIGMFRDIFAGIDDEYLRERGADIEIVGERILRHLLGHQQETVGAVDGKVILVAHDLSPADILQLDRQNIIGFVTDLGGKTSHSAILARALEIPAVVGLERITADVKPGDVLVVDGTVGVVVINPAPETFQDYLSRRQRYEYAERELAKLRHLPAITPDGFRVSLKGNMEFPEEIPSLIGHGGEGVGLYRTEMLYFNRDVLPDEEELTAAYTEVVRQLHPRPVTIRTLDVGGDKFVAGLNLADELNPALGLRAIRLSLRNPETFLPQLKAILRASARGDVRIFFPMISGIAEIRACKRLLELAKDELRAAGHPFDERIKVGIMIEIPSAVLIADLLAREVDFFSVGTNDLIQYALAIDRTNEHLAHLYEPLHPAVLRALKTVVDAAHAAGIDACMCGEMAGDPLYLPVLLGLGFDELSMNAISIPRVKSILRRCPKVDAERLVANLLTQVTAQDVEAHLKGEITSRFAASFD